MQPAGIVHHVIVTVYSFYLMYNSCQNELGEGYPSEKGGSYTKTGNQYGWWHSDACMMEYNKGYTYNILISIAFMTVELYILLKKIKNPTVLNK